MSNNLGELGAAVAGGFHSAAPVSAASVDGDLSETFICISVRKAEERAGWNGGAIWV